jgi:hypothetical protein
MHLAFLNNVKYHETMRTKAEIFMDMYMYTKLVQNYKWKIKGKAVPLQAWGGPEGSRKLRFPDFLTTAQYDGKFVSLTHRPHLPPGNSPGTHFC